MGNSGSHDFSVITDYWLTDYITCTVYNIPIGVKYFYFEMNVHILISKLQIMELSRWTWHEYAVMKLMNQNSVLSLLYNMLNSIIISLIILKVQN